jgi:hypothetical protein
MILNRTLQRIEKALRAQFEVSSTIRHRGERGRQREAGLNRFLRDTLPDAYGVASGEIVPYKGDSPSPQCDTIIYDKLRTPIIGRQDAVQQVPLEGVYAVIETRSVLDSHALKDASARFSAIRALPRCRTKNRRSRSTPEAPFFVLFGYHLKASVDSCRAWVAENASDEDVIVVALDGGISIWIDGHADPLWLYNFDWDTKVETYEVLSIFLAYILHLLRDIDLGKPDFLQMFQGD